MRPGILPVPGVLHPPLQPGTVLNGSFKLISDQRAFFDKLLDALPDPGEFAQALVPGLRSLLDNPLMKGVLDSVVIESLTEYVRSKEFTDRPPRLNCLFGWTSAANAEAFARKYRAGLPHVIYEVEPISEVWFADMEGLNAGLEYFTISFPDSLARQLDRARGYLGAMTMDITQTLAMKAPEVLALGGGKVIATAKVVV